MRRTKSMIALVALLAGALSVLASPAASAQTGYPPGPCSVAGGTRFVGNFTVGDTFTVRVAPVCLWTPGSLANVVVNGAAPFTKVVEADGAVTLTVIILSPTDLSVNPIVPGRCGLNTINVTAPSAAAGGQLVTETVTFNVVCPGVPGFDINICNAGDGGAGGSGLGLGGNATGGSASGTGSSGGTSSGGAGAGTGGTGGAGGDACNINIFVPVVGGSAGAGGSGGAGGAGGSGGAGGAGGAAGAGGTPGAAGTPGAPGAPGAPGRPGVGFLPRTGAEFATWGAVALALVLVGTGLTVAARRRRAIS